MFTVYCLVQTVLLKSRRGVPELFHHIVDGVATGRRSIGLHLYGNTLFMEGFMKYRPIAPIQGVSI